MMFICFKPCPSLLHLIIFSIYIYSTSSFPLFDESVVSGYPTSFEPDPQPWLVSFAGSWMESLPNDTLLNEISIPGTHDSGALFGGLQCETQTWSIEEQLNAGIRYFDIRNRRTNDSFDIYHSSCYQHMSFGDVLDQVCGFLAAHPGETLLMRVKEEYVPEEGSQSFERIWQSYMKDYGRFFVEDLNDTIPTLGEVRGRVLVLRNADFDGYGIRFHGNATDLQDFYKVFLHERDNPVGGDSVSLPQKERLVAEYLDKAMSSSRLVLNHLSGSVGLDPASVAKATNAVAYEKIGSHKGKQTLGVVIMDFPGDKLVYRILKTNFAPVQGSP